VAPAPVASSCELIGGGLYSALRPPATRSDFDQRTNASAYSTLGDARGEERAREIAARVRRFLRLRLPDGALS
jgi:hypothetical protein